MHWAIVDHPGAKRFGLYIFSVSPPGGLQGPAKPKKGRLWPPAARPSDGLARPGFRHREANFFPYEKGRRHFRSAVDPFPVKGAKLPWKIFKFAYFYRKRESIVHLEIYPDSYFGDVSMSSFRANRRQSSPLYRALWENFLIFRLLPYSLPTDPGNDFKLAGVLATTPPYNSLPVWAPYHFRFPCNLDRKRRKRGFFRRFSLPAALKWL